MTGMEQYIIVYSKYIITLFMLLYCVLAFVGPFSAGWRGHKLDNIQGILIFLIQFVAFFDYLCGRRGMWIICFSMPYHRSSFFLHDDILHGIYGHQQAAGK